MTCSSIVSAVHDELMPGRIGYFYRASTAYLLDQINGLLKIHAEVNECPLNALTLVFFLFEYEHMLIEELLQFLVGEVDAELLKTVELRV